ncbi:flagellar export protein FliJ [Anaerosacchariphilus polymeriproducens]|uniref:Flagellar FliJ protein n=1 Tax=Anaerosacchariphilus polymeriproducens TaxID=1812858 RepID=A0A371AS82_9FIRM|nr:flagellar export protein FliJ [Anaerosacchariphilus polymeriproducens]RDU22433.1 flagellar export protein FliJ [Anaerosacchariphilus polymeriproducens]
MAKFIYRMQNILEIKRKLEMQAKSDYAEASQRLVQEEKKLAELKLKQQEFEGIHKNLLMSAINLLEIKNCRKSIEGIKGSIKNQMISVHVAQKNLEMARVKLGEVMLERKTYEKLKEKAFEDFKQEVNVQESKEIDELVSYIYGNNK